MSLSQYYKFNEEYFIASCNRCNITMDIFYGTDALIHHIHFEKDQCLRSPKDNNVNRMTQESITEKNTDTSSHHDNINRQAPRNKDRQR